MFVSLIWVVFEKSLNFILSFLSMFFISKGLGVEDFGIYSFNISVVLLLLSVARVGLNNVVVSKVSKKSHKNPALLIISSFCLKFVFGFACVVMATVFVFTFNPKFFVSFAFYFLFLFYAFEVSSFFLMGRLKFKLISLISFANNSLFCVMKFFLYQRSADVSDYLFLYFLQFSSLFVIHTYFLYKYRFDFSKYSYKDVKLYSRKLFFTVSPAWLAFVFNALYMQSDVIMLGFLSSNTQVSFYGLASSLMYQLYVIPSVLIGIILPYLARVPMSDLLSCWKRYHWFGGVVMVIISLTIYLIFPYIFNFYWGEEYKGTVRILNVLLLNVPMSYFLLSINNFNVISNRLSYNLYTSLVGFLVNILLNFLLIPGYGAYGAAVASFISYLVMVFGVYLVLDRRLVVPW